MSIAISPTVRAELIPVAVGKLPEKITSGVEAKNYYR